MAPTSDRSTSLCCLRQTPRARRPSVALGVWLRSGESQWSGEGRTQQRNVRITGNNQSPSFHAGGCRSPPCGRQGRRSHGGVACADGVASPARRAPTIACAETMALGPRPGSRLYGPHPWETRVERVERSHAPGAPKDAVVRGYGASSTWMCCARLSEAGRRSQPMRHTPALPRLPPKPTHPTPAPTVAVAVASAAVSRSCQPPMLRAVAAIRPPTGTETPA